MAEEVKQKDKVKKKKKRKKGHCKGTRHHSYKRGAERARRVAKIFDQSTDDLTYVKENPALMKAHIAHINKCEYNGNSFLAPLMVESEEGDMVNPKSFSGFLKYYKNIYNMWMHLINSCYIEDYRFYPFFGRRGIKISNDFLDSRKFCIWCLQNGLTRKPFMYDQYLQRKNKTKGYSADNCYIITEKELHTGKSVQTVLNQVGLIRSYETEHDPSVSYLVFYTRYYMYDFCSEDARMLKYKNARSDIFGFSPITFYKSVADENSCSMSTFMSRIHYSYLNGGFVAHPYDMLKPDYSVDAEAAKQGKISYKRKWNMDKKEKEGKGVYVPEVNDDVYIKPDEDVYTNCKDLDVYS